MATFLVGATAGTNGANLDAFHVTDYLQGSLWSLSATQYVVGGDSEITLRGVGFTYDIETLVGGTIHEVQVVPLRQGGWFTVSGLDLPVQQFRDWAWTSSDAAFKSSIFAGADLFQGGAGGDLMRAYGGADSLTGAAGADTLDGGAGADTISGGEGNDNIVDAAGLNYLRGDDGADRITGGSDFDDINGNMGDDTASGAGGDDWVVGGRDNDVLDGGSGADIVYGNLGNDWCDGGEGADIVRGGQGADVVFGQAGDDWLSGDRGDDTLTGGAGADIFHSFAEAGIDRVTDFSAADGDRVQLDPGTAYTLAQVGADTVVDMGGGNQVVLVGVQLSTLPDGWIIGG